jgi:DNA-binding transcriptional LysR family regulator
MRTLVLFAEEGSIQKVAERLPLTQPAVTRQIQRLEQALGAELLDRRQKPPRLTPIGEEALLRSRAILAAYAELKALAKQAEPEGVLRLGVASRLAGGGFADAIAEVLEGFPRVSLRLKTAWSADLAQQLRAGQLDAAILMTAEPAETGMAEVIGSEALAVVAAPELARKAGKAWDELPWILSPEPCETRRQLATALSLRGRRLSLAAEVQDAGLQLDLVRNGLGLGVMPRRLMAQQPPVGIEIVEAARLNLALDVVILRSPHLRALSKVIDALRDRVVPLMGTRP